MRAADTISIQHRIPLNKKFTAHRLGWDFSATYVVPTHDFISGENKKGKSLQTKLDTHLKYSFKFSPDTYWGREYPHTYQGIGVAYNTFFNRKEMGSPVAVYVLQGSRIATFRPNLSLDYEWNFGASFGWKEHDAQTNPFNGVVGSKVNAYINLNFLLNWRFSSCWNLTAGVSGAHYSNGNTSYPNLGVNAFGLRIGVARTLGEDRSEHTSRVGSNSTFQRYLCYDLMLFGGLRRKTIFPEDGGVLTAPGIFGVAGFNFAPMYNVNKYFRAGLSVDAQFDESANIVDHIAGEYTSSEDLRFYRPSFMEQFALGFSLRGELVMPIFSINLGVGRNVICKGRDMNNFYQILALKVKLVKNLYLHVGYQLYKFEEPKNLMLGFGYRFKGRR